MMRFSWPWQGADSAGLPKFSSASQLWVSPCLWQLMLPSQLTSICSRSFCCGTGLQALTACLRIPAPSAGVKICTHYRWFGRPQNAACPSYWESPMGFPNCTGFSGFAWGLITSQLRRAAISTCLGPVVSATCATLEHQVMRGIRSLSAIPWQFSSCNSLHSCCLVPAS